MKEDGTFGDLTILVVSTESNAAMKERGKAAGVRGWIIKPINAEKVVAVVKKLLG